MLSEETVITGAQNDTQKKINVDSQHKTKSMLDSIRWKVDLYKGFHRNNQFGFGIDFVIKDIFIQRYRKEHYLLWKNAPRVIARNVYGVNYTENTPSAGLREVYFSKIYTRFAEFVPTSEDVVVDAGAQFGDYALLCSTGFHAKKVFAFEPLLSNFELLTQNIFLNGATGIVANKVALGNSTKEMEVFHENDMVNSFGYGIPETIKIEKLDSYGIENPTIMKIDVEGFEMELLLGSMKTIKTYLPKIIIETHSRKLKSEVSELLTSLGYHLRHTIKNRAPKGQPEMDHISNLFFSVG